MSVVLFIAASGLPETLKGAEAENTACRLSSAGGLYSGYMHEQYEKCKRIPEGQRTVGQQRMIWAYEGNYEDLQSRRIAGEELSSELLDDLRKHEERLLEYGRDELRPRGY